MAVEIVNKQNIESFISQKGIVLIDFWAKWCNPCKDFAPVFEKVAKKNPKIKFGKLDTQAEKELIKEIGIEHIPTLTLFRDGIMLLKQPGYVEEEKLDDILRQAESVDMDAVKKQIEINQGNTTKNN